MSQAGSSGESLEQLAPAKWKGEHGVEGGSRGWGGGRRRRDRWVAAGRTTARWRGWRGVVGVRSYMA
jgi:hypothetical protein